MIEIRKFLLLVILVTITLPGCFRGRPSDKPPIHWNPNMDTQDKYKPERESEFFADKSTMRTPVKGTVAIGQLHEDEAYYRGKNAEGGFIPSNPMTLTRDLLLRGQERFNIYCSPCHGRAGDGKGIITKYEYPIPPTSFHQDRIRSMPDGQLFDVITNGIRSMPSYRHQIPVEDRWAIIGYVRALQRSQNASLSDVPEKIRSTFN
ncbi:MAG: cytochrome c [FCB group bacterium]|nr:cytochrome c [FCB group bacterium]